MHFIVPSFAQEKGILTTQKDIAQHLGVSVTTVSLALRGDSQISEEMQTRVQDVASQMGYTYRPRKRVNAAAKRIAYIAASNVSGTGPFYSGVLHGAEQEAAKRDIVLSFVQLHEDAIVPNLPNERDLDGLLLVGAVREATVEVFKGLGLPMVLVNNNLPHMKIDRVLIENTYSIYRSVKQLADWGHQRIATLHGPLHHTSFDERLTGYRQALHDLDLQSIEIDIGVGATSLESAERTMAAYLKRNHGPDFTALIACCDQVAIGAIRALHDYGTRVPDDVSVIGFDDIEMASIVSPALTTNRVHRRLLGALGIRTLLRRIEHPERPTTALIVDTTFIARDSTSIYQHVTEPQLSSVS